MGVEPSHPSDPYDVQTLPQPMVRDEVLSLTSLPIGANLLDIKNSGDQSSRMENRQGRLIRWRAAFKGDIAKLYVNGRPMHAEHGRMQGNAPISWVTTTVAPGTSVIVSQNGPAGAFMIDFFLSAKGVLRRDRANSRCECISHSRQ
jgi:hypothetical protein